MRTYFTKIRARIVDLSKDEYEYCSSKVIKAKLEDRYGEIYRVTWGISPAILGSTVMLISRNASEFEQAWSR